MVPSYVIEITASGVEIAKWLANHPPRMGRVSDNYPGLSLVRSDGGSVVDYGSGSALPHLDEHAHATWVVRRELFDDSPLMLDEDHGPALLSAVAIVYANNALGGLLSRVDNMQVEIRRR
jgi:hypothetical protein